MLITLIIISSIACLAATIIYFKLWKNNKQLKQELIDLNENLKQVEQETQLRWENQFTAWCVTKEKEIRKDS